MPNIDLPVSTHQFMDTPNLIKYNSALKASLTPADDDAAIFASLHSIPRTLQAAGWGAQASLAYKKVFARYPDANSQEHKDAISQTHQELATKLLHVCQNNGGVYIKAAQTFSTIQAVPQEYRK